MRTINCIDLFCGIGGLTYGVEKAGINVVAGYDIDNASRFPYEKNNGAKFICKDIKDIEQGEINSLYPESTDVKMLMGCAPCQPFSTYNRTPRENPSRLLKMGLLGYFGKQIQDVKPDIVSMENVPQLAKETVFTDFVSLLIKEGYHVNWEIVFAPKYGVPQTRKRLLLVASKFGEINLIPPTFTKESYVTVRQTIGSLPPLEEGGIDPSDNLHKARHLSDLNLKRIRASSQGGSWREWPPELLPDAYKKTSGKTYGSVYGRLSWDKPSTTITTQFIGYGSGRFGHPDQDRALSLREGAMLQTFPNDYFFVDPSLGASYSSQQVALQIGNAVPPKLGEVIGKSIILHLNSLG